MINVTKSSNLIFTGQLMEVVSVVFESKDIVNVCVLYFIASFLKMMVKCISLIFNLHSFCCRNFGDKSFQDD